MLADWLQTIELYEVHQSTVMVARLQGISRGVVALRLRQLGLNLRPGGRPRQIVSFEDVNSPAAIARAKRCLRDGTFMPLRNARRGLAGTIVTPRDYLATLQAYLRHQSIPQAAAEIGLTFMPTRQRLLQLGLTLRPRGGRTPSRPSIQDCNDAGFLRELQRRLEVEMALSQWQPGQRPESGEADYLLGATRRLQTFERYLELQRLDQLEAELHEPRPVLARRLLELGLTLCLADSPASLEELNDAKFLHELHRRLEVEVDYQDLIEDDQCLFNARLNRRFGGLRRAG